MQYGKDGALDLQTKADVGRHLYLLHLAWMCLPSGFYSVWYGIVMSLKFSQFHGKIVIMMQNIFVSQLRAHTLRAICTVMHNLFEEVTVGIAWQICIKKRLKNRKKFLWGKKFDSNDLGLKGSQRNAWLCIFFYKQWDTEALFWGLYCNFFLTCLILF